MSQPLRYFHDIREALVDSRELALIDVREEARFAEAHPLFAVNLPLSRLELDVLARIPRRETPITLYDDGEGLAQRARDKLIEIDYRDVALLAGGLQGWREAGGELFRDVNTPSKAFGEWVEHHRGTPSLSAIEVKSRIEKGANIAILDARRFDEFETMSIPGGVSVPGGELALRIDELVPDPATEVIVNCAGRTRSLIGAQSLVDIGLPNPVSALRNGTIGWTLEGFELVRGQRARYQELASGERPALRARASARALELAARSGVKRLSRDTLESFLGADRTSYLVDVRAPEEYRQGHLPGSRSVPGGQLVQETDHTLAVSGARVALIDDDGTRANMSATWLARMGWEVFVVDGLTSADFSETGAERLPRPPLPEVATISPAHLRERLADSEIELLDVTSHANYRRAHVPGARWILRAELADHVARLPATTSVVLTCASDLLARYAWGDLSPADAGRTRVLAGGTAAWRVAQLPLESGDGVTLSPTIDRYRRPYEGTDSPREAMQAYLDWEFGLVEQLRRDATHGFATS
ncbi:MAG: sulfurtransferase [Salinicola sp.]|uniref:rhodanese homology domain-containing protein n=1 Tax=uncultured Salinicola sp. TaxID=1193542 RepID=UPI000C917182|nr:rhodanese homology domain-containing protein [uncultured Salinicola sp.]MAM58590.1 sulfurtransferase [Salinicola sp.]